MLKFILKLFVLVIAAQVFALAQFGKNKVQYKEFTWYYIQTDHLDIYFSQNGADLAEFTAKEAEKSLESIQKSFKFKINNRISIIVYNSTNDFQETNITDQYLSEGIEGFTELFKNRVVIQFMGSYKEFRHLIHHELTHAVINDMFYGGSIQNIIANNITINIPLWFNEGMAEYQSLGWDVNTDMFIRDAAINDYLPDVKNLNGYLAYRGGQAVFNYIEEKYGKQKIGEIINKLKDNGSVNEAFKSALGLDLEEFSERWKKDIKKTYWPDIAEYKDPEEFSKRLTDPEEGGGFYNTAPAISPQGDKLAFITNRNYFFDVYLMDLIHGEIIKKLVEGNRTPDFEQLNVVTPGLSWSPDGTKIALSAKSEGYDVIYIIEVESEDRETLPMEFDAIKELSWSPDGKYIAFIGHDAQQSDVYLYSFEKNEIKNLTNDIFTDDDPSWSPDGNLIFFSSDRRDYLNAEALPDNFKIYHFDYGQKDIYSINLHDKKISRITNLPYSNEADPVVSSDGSEILFISDMNGINNIYKKKIKPSSVDSVVGIFETEVYPVTNSLNGISQLTTSEDRKKLAYATLFEGSYNLFLLNSPFEIDLKVDSLKPTEYIASLVENRNESDGGTTSVTEEPVAAAQSDSMNSDSFEYFTGNYIDTTNVYGDSVKIDFGNYVFGDRLAVNQDTSDSIGTKFTLADKLDENGNYKVNKYKITFSPDLIYANAGYSSLYGLLGTTVISFSDVLGNHRLIGITSLQIDLKNSDYGLSYYYLPGRINYGIEGFHTARFLYLNNGFGSDLFRFRNFGLVGSLSYPLNRFYRIDAGLSWLNLTKENLDDPTDPNDKASLVVPSVSFVHDNVLWGYTSPVEGTRYRFDLLGNPGISDKNLSFYSALGDFRQYFRFFDDYSFAFRLSGGYSDGANPQKFFLGGIRNWINREFATGEVPLESATDFVFLTPAIPLRGYDYAERVASKYGLLNLELRFPLIRYLVTGPLPLLFSNIMGVAFVDMGAAWNKNSQLRLFERNLNGNVVTKDLLIGTGVGARLYFLYFLLRFDVAWAYDFNKFASPKFYISLGADF